MRLSVALPYEGRPRDAVALVPQYELAGADAVWVAEAWGFDSPTMLGYLAALTSRIDICAGIVNVYSRSPTLIAQTIAGLDHLSGGRAVLGLGSSGPQVVEGWHGVAFEHPIARLGDTIETVRRVLRREPIDLSDRIASGRGRGLGKPLRILNRPERPGVPIAVAGLGASSVALAASRADIWLPLFFLPERASQVWDAALTAGGAERQPELGELQVVAGGVLAVDHDIEEARASARRVLARYIGAMGARGANFYFDLACKYGFADDADVIQQLFLAADPAAAAAAVPDELVSMTNLIGSASDVRARVDAYANAGVTELMVTPAGVDQVGQLRRIAALLDR